MPFGRMASGFIFTTSLAAGDCSGRHRQHPPSEGTAAHERRLQAKNADLLKRDLDAARAARGAQRDPYRARGHRRSVALQGAYRRTCSMNSVSMFSRSITRPCRGRRAHQAHAGPTAWPRRNRRARRCHGKTLAQTFPCRAPPEAPVRGRKSENTCRSEQRPGRRARA